MARPSPAQGQAPHFPGPANRITRELTQVQVRLWGLVGVLRCWRCPEKRGWRLQPRFAEERRGWKFCIILIIISSLQDAFVSWGKPWALALILALTGGWQ